MSYYLIKTYKENKYKKFFNYFNKTWLGKTIPKKLWNFSDILDDNKILINFHLLIMFLKILTDI